jgi:hypothetical protein
MKIMEVRERLAKEILKSRSLQKEVVELKKLLTKLSPDFF